MGGGDETTVKSTPDYHYNAQLMKIQKEQQSMSSEMYNFYKHGIGTTETQATADGEWTRINGRWVNLPATEEMFTADEGSVGYQTLEQDTIKAGIEMLPYETGLEKALIEEQQALMLQRAPVREALFDKATDTDSSKAMGRAESDVKHAYAGIQADMDDKAFRSGVDPLSGRYIDATRQINLRKAPDVADARTGAADTFNNQQTAIQQHVAGIPAG